MTGGREGPLTPALLEEVTALVAQGMGLDLSTARSADLVRELALAAKEEGCADVGQYVRGLTRQPLCPRQIETLASHLTVGETYFWREPASFELLEREILPPLLASRSAGPRTLRLWTAGCCTGEEAYSLAMSCLRAVPDLPAWNVAILATDINPRFLAKARAGVYSDWSFRGAPAWLHDRFFRPASDGRLAIEPAAQRLVEFAYLNLARDTYPSLHNHTHAVDVIFCRNVLMYFTAELQQRVVASFHDCLVDGGYLVVSPAEAEASHFPQFVVENQGECIVFRKSAAVAIAPQPEAVPLPDEPVESVTPTPEVPPAPVPALAALARARSEANQGCLAEALQWCQRATAEDRTNPATYFLAAAIHLELGQLPEALAALRRVLFLDPDSALAHHALGGVYRRLGRDRDFRRHLAVALRLLEAKDPNDLVPGSDGMTCGRFAESVRAALEC